MIDLMIEAKLADITSNIDNLHDMDAVAELVSLVDGLEVLYADHELEREVLATNLRLKRRLGELLSEAGL